MKKIFTLLLFSGLLLSISHGQTLKPYTLGTSLDMSLTEAKTHVKTALSSNGIQVLGGYQVAANANRYMYAITSSELKAAVNMVGGKTGFAAALRVGITIEDGKAVVSYTTPAYWGNAYFKRLLQQSRS